MIEIIKRPRQAGKTYLTLNWFCAAPSERMIVTFSEQEANRLRKKAAAILRVKVSEVEKNIVSWRNIARLHGTPGRQVRIDNADYVLRDMIGAHHNLEGVTWNG